VALKYGLANEGAAQVRRERARGGVRERTARTRVAPGAGVQGERVRGKAERAQILAALEQMARGSNGARASGAAAVAWQRANRRRAV
jgi:hypothetical protein